MSFDKIAQKIITQPFANLAALKAYSVASMDNGVKSLLLTNGSQAGLNYYYDSTSSATADDLAVLQPDAGTGRWLLNNVINSESSVTDEHVPRWDGTSGKVMQSSSLRITDTGLVLAENSIAGKNDIEVGDSTAGSHTLRMYVDSGSFYETLQYGTVSGGKSDWMELYADSSENMLHTKNRNFKIRSTANDDIFVVNQDTGIAEFGFSIKSNVTSGTIFDVNISPGNITNIGASTTNALRFDGSSGQVVTSTSNVTIQIDSNNDDTTRYFDVRKGSPDAGGGTQLFRVNQDGTASLLDAFTAATLRTNGNIVANGNNFTCNSFIAATAAAFRFNSSDSGTTNFGDLDLENNGHARWSTADTYTSSTDSYLIGAFGQAVRTLEVFHASNPQLRLTQALGSAYCDFQVDSSDRLNMISTGGLYRAASSDSGSSQYFDIDAENSSHVGLSAKSGPLFLGSKVQFLYGADLTLSGNGETVAYDGRYKRVNPGSSYTGTILAQGTRDGEKITIINSTGGGDHIVWNTTDGTSHIENASLCQIEPQYARTFFYDAAKGLWICESYTVFYIP